MKNAIFWDVAEDGILHCHRRENLKSYKTYDIWELFANENSRLTYFYGQAVCTEMAPPKPVLPHRNV
jgi:hypothetical protein